MHLLTARDSGTQLIHGSSSSREVTGVKDFVKARLQIRCSTVLGTRCVLQQELGEEFKAHKYPNYWKVL